MRSMIGLVVVSILSAAGYARAADTAIAVRVNGISADGVGKEIGTITIAARSDGVSFTPNLHGFDQGKHAFHVHEKPDCGPGVSNGEKVAGLAAGPHYHGGQMPGMAGQTPMGDRGQMGMTMRGDLPELTAAADGSITMPVVKNGLTLAELHGRSIMIHAYGEQPTDPGKPKGGGARVACAVIP